MKIYQGLVWIAAFVLSLSFLGLVGCGSDDDDSPSTTTTVVTNVVNGVTQTNVIVVTNAPLAEDVGEGALSPEEIIFAANEKIKGDWSGSYESDSGKTHIQMTLVPTDQGEIEGIVYFSNDSTGTVSGQFMDLDPTHLFLRLNERLDGGGGREVHLDGSVNAASTGYSGTFTAPTDSGTFSLQKN